MSTRTQDAARMLEEPTGLREWLASHAPYERVGWRQRARECPIATYLHIHTGVWIDARQHAVRLLTPDRVEIGRFFPPAWATRFIRLVDARSGGIRAATALRLLDQAEPEVRS